MGKILSGFLLLLILAGVVFYFGAGYFLSQALSRVIGAPVSVGCVDIGLLSSEVGLYDLKVKNFPNFQEPYLADIPEIYFCIDLPALFRKQIHLTQARVQIYQMTVEKNTQGLVNVLELGIFKPGDRENAGTLRPPASQKGFSTQVDQLEMSIGQVRYVESFLNQPPSIREIGVNIRKEDLRNILQLEAITMDVVNLALERVGMNAAVINPTRAMNQGAPPQTLAVLDHWHQHFPI